MVTERVRKTVADHVRS